MKKLLFTTTLLLLCIALLAQENKVWPIKNHKFADQIIHQRMERGRKVVRADEFYIHTIDSDTIVSPVDGVITNISYCYRVNPFRVISSSITAKTKDYKTKFFSSFKKSIKNIKDKKYITICVCIRYSRAHKIYLTGIKLLKEFKTGDKVKAGDILGIADYSFPRFDHKSLIFSLSKFGKIDHIFDFYGIKKSDALYNKFHLLPIFKGKRKNYANLKLTPKQLKQDFDIFIKAIREGYPGLYDYTSKVVLDSVIAQKYKELNKPLTVLQFWAKLREVDHLLKDSHTYIYHNNMRLFTTFLDVNFGIENNKLKIIATRTKYATLRNKEIKSINGIAAQDIISNVKKVFNYSDGYIQSDWKHRAIKYFTYDYFLYYNVKKGQKIKIRLANDSIYEFKVYNRYKKVFPSLNSYSSRTNIAYKHLNNGTLYIDLNSFYLMDTEFDTIQKHVLNPKNKNIIIDLRDNPGGSDIYLNKLFALFAQKQFKSFCYNEVKKQSYLFFKTTENYYGIDSMYKTYTKEGDRYRLYNKKPIQPISQKFNRRLFVLINENSNSASTCFAALVRDHKVGILIGRETGTTYHQMNAIDFAKVLLTHSGLTFRMPLIKIVYSKQQDKIRLWGRGVMPHYTIELNIKTLTTPEDLFINKAKELIKNKENLINQFDNSKNEISDTSDLSLFMLIFLSILVLVLLIVLIRVMIKKHNKK